MKKLLLLSLMTLLSVTAVMAQNSALKLMGNGIDHPTGNIGGSGGNTWTYTCPGSYFNTWNIVQNNKIYFRPIVDNGGNNERELFPNGDYTITNSGSSYEFKYNYGNDNHGGGSVAIDLPNDYANKTFTFYLSNYVTNDSESPKITVTVSWTPALKLKSTLDSFVGTAYDSYDSSTGEYTWTWTRSDLSGKSGGDKLYFYLYNADNTTSYGCWSGHDNSEFDMTTDGGWYECNEGSNQFFVTHTEGNSYVIKAKYETNSAGSEKVWKIHVDVDAPIKLTSTIDSWRGTGYESEDNGVYTWTWTKQQLSGYAEGAKLEFYLTQGSNNYGSYDHNGANEFDMTNFSGWYGCLTGSTYHFYVTYSKGNTYTIQAKKNGSNWDVQLITIDGVHDYYWVSPQITNNQKLDYFKMVPSRNRSRNGGDGKTSTKYFSFTIKDNDLKKWDGSAWQSGDEVQWYVVRDDDAKWFRPTTDNIHQDIETTSNIYDDPNRTDDEDFHTVSLTDCGTIDKNNNYYLSFTKGEEVSYTFILNSKPSTGSGNLFVDAPVNGRRADTSGSNNSNGYEYFLIGNFTSATNVENIDISNTEHPMTKLYYKDGNEYSSTVASPDSIVYQCKVDKPNGGWGDLYLLINPANNTTNADANWKKVYRPLISLYNNLDGRALVGGLTKCGGGWTDSNPGDQALNPEPSEFYSGYTFRFNATTMTYNLKFHSSLYLVGDAVTADGKGGSWDLDGTTNQTAYLIPLNATQETNHFRNKVTFKNGAKEGTDNGKGFRFLVKEDENTDAPYNRNWGEDANAPKFTSLEENVAHYAGTDTQYKNYLKYNTGNAFNTDRTGGDTNNKDIIFDLPDGEYTINFFNYGENSYYTIEREAELRDFNDVVYKGTERTILGRGGYNFFRVWSDYIAWNKPEDVDVYVVTNFSPSGGANEDFDWHAASITLTKQNINYIPANTGVILAMKTDKNSLKGGMYYDEVKDADKATNTGYNNAWMQMTPYTEPGATVDNKGVLIPLYQATNLQRYEGEGSEEKANYLFGFYRANRVIANYDGDQEDFLLGFWQTTGVGNTYPNSAFLQLTRAQSDALGVGASYTVSEGGSGAPAFMLLFDDSGSDTVTGITDVNVQTPAQQLTNDHWYTLEGVRISAPTTKGIYIHGGKKVIVR